MSKQSTNDVWMPVDGYENFYRVSQDGRVERCRYTITTSGGVRTTFPARELRFRANERTGHLRVVLYRDRMRETLFVHHVVLRSFGFPKPDHRSVCRHLDGNPANNCIANLAWGSAQENAIDACFHGTYLKKLSIEDMITIRARLRENPYRGASIDLAEEYGVSPSAISHVKRRRTGHYAA